MQAIEEAFGRLVEALQWFVVAPEQKALHVRTEPALWEASLRHIVAQEGDSRNRSAFLLLETPHTGADGGWDDRTAELRAEYDALRETLSEGEDPIELPPLPDAPGGNTALVRFGQALQQVSQQTAEPLRGWTVVAAPGAVEHGADWGRDLATLAAQRTIQNVRWIVMETNTTARSALKGTLGDGLGSVDADVSILDKAKQLGAMIQSLKNVPKGAGGFARIGAPGPKVAPPPRVNQPPKVSEEDVRKELVKAGLPPGLLDVEATTELRLKILTAAEHASEQNWPEAIRAQGEARDAALKIGLERESIILEHILGCFVMQAGGFKQALDVFRKVEKRAEQGKFYPHAVQAQLSVASVFLALGQPREAAVEYAKAGKLGEQSGVPVLAMEGYRLAGDLLSQHGDETNAAKAWQNAIQIAEATPPEEQIATTAPIAARALADLCDKRGLREQAESLRQRAELLENPPAPAAAKEPA